MKLIEKVDVKRDLIMLDKVDPNIINDTKMFSMFLAEELEIYKRKRKDYGTHPIQETGIVGLMVRILDKTHRVLHLSENGRTITVTDENIKDSLMDIANYSYMALLEIEHKRMGKWQILKNER